jgi:hypothetical protein
MDYTYPSIFFSNLMFFILLGGAVYFCIRTRKGYWGPNSEEPKYRMLKDDDDLNEVKHG